VIVGLLACTDPARLYDEGDARIVANRAYTVAEFVFAEAWCASVVEPPEPHPGGLTCPAPAALTVQDGVVSGVTARGVGVDGTLARGETSLSADLEVVVDDVEFDELGREIAVTWEGPLEIDAVAPGFYEVAAFVRGQALVDRPRGEDRVVHERAFDLSVRWGTDGYGSCVGRQEAVVGRVGDVRVDWGRIVEVPGTCLD
jgi:hypothetical protein